MDTERAESYLRLLAEAELRRVTARHKRGEFVVNGPHGERLRRIARPLIAVGAIDDAVAESILIGFELAVAVRLPSAPDRRLATVATHSPAIMRRLARLAGVTSRQVAPSASAAMSTQLTPARIVSVGMMIPVRNDDNAHGELYLVAYSQTAAGARWIVAVVLRGAPGIHPPGLLANLTATDDQGHAYQLKFTGGGDMTTWAGLLSLQPDPPPGIRWLELTVPNGSARRVSLEPLAHPPAITVTEITDSPGEYLLHLVATQILTWAANAAVPVPHLGPDPRPRPRPGARPIPSPGARRFTGPMPPDYNLIAGLGETVEALLAVGALSALSPVPGQLAALCESLDLDFHGITAPPVRDLPKPWLGLLAYAHRRKRDNTMPRRGCAGVTVTLPELDGVTISVLGLHADETGTALHLLARGGPRHLGPDTSGLPMFWLRDDGNHWHTTYVSRWNNTHGDGEATAQLQIVPPLTGGTSLDLVATGRSAQVRTTLPLDWR